MTTKFVSNRFPMYRIESRYSINTEWRFVAESQNRRKLQNAMETLFPPTRGALRLLDPIGALISIAAGKEGQEVFAIEMNALTLEEKENVKVIKNNKE